ncbi:TetR/AcrR family transcriptional regulator [Planctomycetota bacterium]|nr:TetR/AcrR family transcriptional regulator [Planctomycetota bacterium]
MTAMTYKEREFQRRENDLLDALLECLQEAPLEQITIESIANHIGIAKGTVYKHVSTKDDLIAKLSLREFGDLHNLMVNVDQNRPVPVIIKDLITLGFKHMASHQTMGIIDDYVHSPNFKSKLSPEVREEIEHKDKEFDSFFIDLMQRGIDEGDIPNIPAKTLCDIIHFTMIGAYEGIWGCNAEEFTPNEILKFTNHYTSFILGGILSLED